MTGNVHKDSKTNTKLRKGGKKRNKKNMKKTTVYESATGNRVGSPCTATLFVLSDEAFGFQSYCTYVMLLAV